MVDKREEGQVEGNFGSPIYTQDMAIEKAEKIVKVCEILGVKPDELIDYNDNIALEDFKETISQQCDSDDDFEPGMIINTLDKALERIRHAVKKELTDVFVEEYYIC